jgi:hypothetical protein
MVVEDRSLMMHVTAAQPVSAGFRESEILIGHGMNTKGRHVLELMPWPPYPW